MSRAMSAPIADCSGVDAPQPSQDVVGKTATKTASTPAANVSQNSSRRSSALKATSSAPVAARPPVNSSRLPP
jgi:hypothetical protein